jgi:hypothetical protein
VWEGGDPDTTWYSASGGTAANPYIISTAEQLSGLAQLVDRGETAYEFNNKYFALSGDIDLRGLKWNPIGYENSAAAYCLFKGVFDGRGYTISGLYVPEAPGQFSAGLFAGLEAGGVIRNLRVEGRVESPNEEGAGGITAINLGLIENCVVSADIVREGPKRAYAGLISGLIRGGVIRNCISMGSVSGFGKSYSYAGGMVGMNSGALGAVENCVTSADALLSYMNSGGMMASNLSNGDINNCVSLAALYSGGYRGGVAGLGAYGRFNYWLYTGPEQPSFAVGYSSAGTVGRVDRVSRLPIVSVAPFRERSLGVGRAIKLEADLYPIGGFRKDITYKWVNSAPTVVSIEHENGSKVKITGLATGTAEVTITIDNPRWGPLATTRSQTSTNKSPNTIYAVCRVTVSEGGPGEEPASITIEPDEIEDDDGWDDEGESDAERAPVEAGMAGFTDAEAIPDDVGVSHAELAGESYRAKISMTANLPPESLSFINDSQALTEAVASVLALALYSGIDGVVPLPSIRASFDSGSVASLCFDMIGSLLMSDGPSDVKVATVGPGGWVSGFSYAASESDYTDGAYVILRGGERYDGVISGDERYQLVIFVRDGGKFDIDTGQGDVLALPFIAETDAEAGTGTQGDPDHSILDDKPQGGGGCTAGAFVLALIVLVPFILGKKISRSLPVVLLALAVLASLSGSSSEAWNGGVDYSWYYEGKTRFTLTTAEQVAGLAYLVNSQGLDFYGVRISLAADVNLKGYNWTPIGSDRSKLFDGKFDGQGHMVEFSLSDTGSETKFVYGGFFGVIGENATISDVLLRGSVETTSFSSESKTGGVVGFSMGGSLDGVSFAGEIKSRAYNVGGLAGAFGDTAATGFEKSLSNSAFSGFIEAYNAMNAGGIVGYNGLGQNIDGCSVSADIRLDSLDSTSSHPSVGGIAGRNDCTGDAKIRGCSFSGVIYSMASAGGIVGNVNRASLATGCDADAAITHRTRGGGVFGYMSAASVISNCRFEGCITSIGGSYTGGLAAAQSGTSSASVSGSAASCDITVVNLLGEHRVGGLASATGPTRDVENSLWRGSITVDGGGGYSSNYNIYIGGLVGDSNARIENSAAVGRILVRNMLLETPGSSSSTIFGAFAGGIVGTHNTQFGVNAIRRNTSSVAISLNGMSVLGRHTLLAGGVAGRLTNVADNNKPAGSDIPISGNVSLSAVSSSDVTVETPDPSALLANPYIGYHAGGLFGYIASFSTGLTSKEQTTQAVEQIWNSVQYNEWLANGHEYAGVVFPQYSSYYDDELDAHNMTGIESVDSVLDLPAASAVITPPLLLLKPGESGRFEALVLPEGSSEAQSVLASLTDSSWAIPEDAKAASAVFAANAATIDALRPGSADVSLDVTGLYRGHAAALSSGVFVAASNARAPSEISVPGTSTTISGVMASYGGESFAGEKLNGVWTIVVPRDADIRLISVSAAIPTGARVTRPDISLPVDFSGGIVEFEVTAEDGYTSDTELVRVILNSARQVQYYLVSEELGEWSASAVKFQSGSVSVRVDIPLEDARQLYAVLATVRGIDYPLHFETAAAGDGSAILSLYGVCESGEAFEEAVIERLDFWFEDDPNQHYYQILDFGATGAVSIKEIMSVNPANTEISGSGGGCDAGAGAIFAAISLTLCIRRRWGVRFLAVLLMTALAVFRAGPANVAYAWDGSADTDWYTESENSFALGTADELAGLAVLVNGGADFSGKTVSLNSGVNLGGANWTPIGTYNRQFKGTFEGNGHKITFFLADRNLTSPYLHAGFFGVLGEGGAIRGLLLEGDIDATSSYYSNSSGAVNSSTGGVVGMVDRGSVDGVSFVGSVTAKSAHVGGVVGSVGIYLSANSQVSGLPLKNLSFSGEVTASNTSVGGIAGAIYQKLSGMENCGASGMIRFLGTTSYSVGGVLGRGNVFPSENVGLVIRDCSFTGVINSLSSAGGILGDTSQSCDYTRVTGCRVDADIENYARGGGIAARLFSSNEILENCSFNGRIKVRQITSTTNIQGGILGEGAGQFTQIVNCEARADISVVSGVTQNASIGGVLGYSWQGTVKDSSWHGEITVPEVRPTSVNNGNYVRIGGVAGLASGSLNSVSEGRVSVFGAVEPVNDQNNYPQLIVGGTIGELSGGDTSSRLVRNCVSNVEIDGEVKTNESADFTRRQGGVYFGGIVGYTYYAAGVNNNIITDCVSLSNFTANVADYTAADNITDDGHKALTGYKAGGIVGAMALTTTEAASPADSMWHYAGGSGAPVNSYAGNGDYFTFTPSGVTSANSVSSMPFVSALLSPVASRVAAGDRMDITAAFYPVGAGGVSPSGAWSHAANPVGSALFEQSGGSAAVEAVGSGVTTVSFDVTLPGGYDAGLSSRVFVPGENPLSGLMDTIEVESVDALAGGARIFTGQRVGGDWNILVSSDVSISRLSIAVGLNTGARVTKPDVSGEVDFSAGPIEFEVTAPDGLAKRTFNVTVFQENPVPGEYPSSMAWLGLGKWRADITAEGGMVRARFDIPLTGDDALSFINVMSGGNITVEGIELRGANGDEITLPMEESPSDIYGCTMSVYVSSPSIRDFIAASIGGLVFELAGQPEREYRQSFSFGVDEILREAVVTGDTLDLGGGGARSGGGGGCDTGLTGLFALAIFAVMSIPLVRRRR